MNTKSNASALEISSMIQSQYKSLKASHIQEDSQLRFFHVPTKRSGKQSQIHGQSQSQWKEVQKEEEEVFLVENDIHEDMFIDQIPEQTDEYEYHHFDPSKQMKDRHQMEIQKYQETKVQDIQKDLDRLNDKKQLFYQDLEGFDQKLNKFQDEFNKTRKQNQIQRAKQQPFLQSKFGVQVDYEMFEPVLEQNDEKFSTDDLKLVILKERNKNQELYDEIDDLKQKYQFYDQQDHTNDIDDDSEQESEQESEYQSSIVQSFETKNVNDQSVKKKQSLNNNKYRPQRKLQQNQFNQKYINQLNNNKNIQMNITKNQQNKNGKPPLNKNGKPPLNNKRPQSMKTKHKVMQLDNEEREKHLKGKIKELYNKEIYK